MSALAGVAPEGWWEAVEPPSMLGHHLAKHIAERDADRGWRRLPLGEANPYAAHPERLAEHRRAFCGPASATVPGVRWRGVVDEQWPISDGELARAYLRSVRDGGLSDRGGHGEGMSRRRVPFRRADLWALDLGPAYYFDPVPARGWWAYVDIAAAYPSLWLPVGLDPDFNPAERVFGLGRMPFPAGDEVLMDRALRLAVFGSVLNPTVSYIERGTLVDSASKLPNRYFSPALRGWVLGVVNSVAVEAVQLFGCTQWIVDAGIVHASRAQEMIAWLRDRWGLVGRCEAAGEGHRWSLYDYAVGPRVTRRAAAGNPQAGQPVDSLTRWDRRTRDWLAGCSRTLVGSA